jgi:prophage regulatory protein
MKSQDLPCLRVKQAAALLGIGESTIWRWVKERPGFPQPFKIGSRVTVWRAADLVTWCNAQATEVHHARLG